MDTRMRTGMVKRLTKHGNSLALVIDRAVLDLLEIDAKTPLSITTDGKCLVISPVRDAKRRKAFEDALAEVNRKFGRVLKRLAD
jgi:antitoxin component of MazEF toxin-antitoxin module